MKENVDILARNPVAITLVLESHGTFSQSSALSVGRDLAILQTAFQVGTYNCINLLRPSIL